MAEHYTESSYRGRDQMTLVELVEDIEACHFRTGHDTGADTNALFVWNLIRQQAGLDRLTHDDLIQRHADSKGWTFEEMKEDYRQMDNYRRAGKFED